MPNRDGLPPAALCDLDGTLCDVRSIHHLVERPENVPRFRADFAAFHGQSRHCPPFPQVSRLISGLASAGYEIILVTGREAKWASLTEDWLAEHGITYSALLTRRSLDYRADEVIKQEIFLDIAAQYSPRIAVDDRDDILRVWLRAGIPTIAVDLTGNLSSVIWPTGVMDVQLQADIDHLIGTTSTTQPNEHGEFELPA